MAEIDIKLMNMPPEVWRSAFVPLPDRPAKAKKKAVKKAKKTTKKK